MSQDASWWNLYLKHGTRIHAEGMGRHRVARLFGLDLNEARRLVYYIKTHGPPGAQAVQDLQDATTTTHMVIGDAHAAPGYDLSRFEWAARFALDHRPDVIVSIGDWFGLDSLCYHHSKLEAEGLRLLDDLKAGNQALALFDKVIKAHNRLNPEDQYNPRKVVTLGNHDHRIMRQAAEHPSLEGILGYQMMHWDQYGWETVPFKQPIDIDGVNYCHYFTKPGSPRAISGMHHAASLVREGMGKTLACGHSHQLQWYTKARHDGKRAHGLVVGCYFDHHEDYAGTANAVWWRGLVLLRNVKEGDFDLETWSLDRIGAKYGNVRP